MTCIQGNENRFEWLKLFAFLDTEIIVIKIKSLSTLGGVRTHDL